MIKKIYLLLLLPCLCFSQIPSYYNSIDFNQNGQPLESDLAQLITNTHTTELPYTSSQPDTWDAVKQTDLVPGDSDNVLLFYGYDDNDGNSETDYTRDKDLSCHTTSCTGLFNREHVYARSIATPALTTDEPGPGTDAHNLRACDGDMNTTRSNRLFEEGAGNSHITGSGNWYPGDEWKGDVARIVMYMFLRYPTQCPANDIGTGANTHNAGMPDVFLQWNVEDPVSEYETQRNTVLE
ncbi:endonuclease, partial [Aestuariivivens sp. NBU2969]|uniref:endonuclease n=1 Tax=Aestuariivivens sp. NBU2969 TaxID=2873267 RepID=UPI001CBFEA33